MTTTTAPTQTLPVRTPVLAGVDHNLNQLSSIPRPVLDVVIPVYNEEASLGASVTRVARYLDRHIPYPARITVVDNASTDATWAIAQRLVVAHAARQAHAATSDDGEQATDSAPSRTQVRAVHLDLKGRGRALRQVWLDSDADVLAYMDVDLSTDLAALPALIAPLISGHSQLAIGTRLAPSSRVERGLKREFISRTYNLLLRRTMSAKFSDAQCGFKAITRDAAQELLPLVEDTGWFFDTELLVLAERAGLRIHEVPVDWVDDPDSRVDIVSTASQDLKGMLRVTRNLARGRVKVHEIARHLGIDPASRSGKTMGSQLVRFTVVGIICTVLYSGLYLLLRAVIDPQVANFVAYALSSIIGTSLHRRITFGVRDPATAVKHQGQGLVVFAASWGLSALALAALHAAWPTSSGLVEVALLTFANLLATALRFVLFRSWVFRPGH